MHRSAASNGQKELIFYLLQGVRKVAVTAKNLHQGVSLRSIGLGQE